MLKLDDRDLKILAVLQRQGRITKAALARAVNLSASPCWERLRRLEEAGVITGYRASVAPNVLARVTTVFMEAGLESHRGADFERFEKAMSDLPEVVGCWAVGGGIDYLVQIVVPDIDTYQRLVDRLLASDLGLMRYYTYVVTRAVKVDAPLPLERLMRAEA